MLEQACIDVKCAYYKNLREFRGSAKKHPNKSKKCLFFRKRKDTCTVCCFLCNHQESKCYPLKYENDLGLLMKKRIVSRWIKQD